MFLLLRICTKHPEQVVGFFYPAMSLNLGWRGTRGGSEEEHGSSEGHGGEGGQPHVCCQHLNSSVSVFVTSPFFLFPVFLSYLTLLYETFPFPISVVCYLSTFFVIAWLFVLSMSVWPWPPLKPALCSLFFISVFMVIYCTKAMLLYFNYMSSAEMPYAFYICRFLPESFYKLNKPKMWSGN